MCNMQSRTDKVMLQKSSVSLQETLALLMRKFAVMNKLAFWLELLVLMDHNLLPEGSGLERLCPG